MLRLWLILGMVGCGPETGVLERAPTMAQAMDTGPDKDDDGDGFCENGEPVATTGPMPRTCSGTFDAALVDCDDDDDEAFPGNTALVVGDGIDNNCSDGGVGDECYQDLDLDDAGSTTIIDSADATCADDGESLTNDDCDDDEAAAFPLNTLLVVGDGIDNNCSDGGAGDECYEDLDGDDFGSTTIVDSPDIACDAAGESDVSTDCDDDEEDAFPLNTALVVGDGIDNNCTDGGAGDECYEDLDGDDFGSTTIIDSPDSTCDAAGESDVSTDCDDNEEDAFPLNTALVVGDGIDNNCTHAGVGDECYEDLDGDDAGSTTIIESANASCADSGESATDDDCDDDENAAFPLNTVLVVGDGIDNNCSDAGVGDECYEDLDGDDFGSTTIIDSPDSACDAVGESDVSTDCDDNEEDAFPLNTALVVGDGIDNNCTHAGVGDECYRDLDLDDAGTSTIIESANASCADSGESLTDDDCDDDEDAAFPLNTVLVVGDGIDNNCTHAGIGDECYADVDEDGFGSTTIIDSPDAACDADGESDDPTDCDDGDGLEFPGNPDRVVLDGRDNDCSGGADECYEDLDGDGTGSAVVVDSVDADCDDTDESPTTGDCDDDEPTVVGGGGIVVGDGLDNDCSGDGDECYRDLDGDTFGTAIISSTDADCDDPGEAIVDGDCQDGDANTFPGAAELESATECRTDVDGDGFGDNTPVGGVIAGTDCDDAEPAVFLGAVETCNFRDDDCDGERDNGFDVDGDGVTTCGDDGLVGATADNDCDDSNPNVFPGNPVVIGDGLDNDCTGGADECYRDNDGDTFGVSAIVEATVPFCVSAGESTNADDCFDGNDQIFPGAAEFESGLCMADVDLDGFGDASPAPGVEPGSDCDDDDDAVFFGAGEVCNAVDDNCDGDVDEPFDGDGDGATTCGADGTAGNADDDCDDGRGDVGPGFPELCDGIDNDCDGDIDEAVTLAWYADTDGDGFGDPAVSTLACVAPPGTVADSTDCDDDDPAAFPGAAEVFADGVDQDCDGTDACYVDGDGDGVGSTAETTGVLGCVATGTSPVNTDCDDARGDNFPGNAEICDGLDNDCDGVADQTLGFVDYYPDVDGDDFGDRTATGVSTCDGAPTGFVTDNTDCDDGSGVVFPGASEVVANTIDEDCDGTDDCFEDLDGDGFGTASVVPGDDLVCTGPGESELATDCDDGDPVEMPGQIWFADCDADGFYAPDELVGCALEDADLLSGCGTPSGGYANAAPAEADCDDLDAVEQPNQSWYADCDGDGAHTAVAVVACTEEEANAATPCEDGLPPADWVNTAPVEADCDDELSLRSPLLDEICEPFGQPQVDNDCDLDVNTGGPDGGDPTNALAFHADQDLDGFGAPGDVVFACEAAPGLVPNDADCDDLDPTIFTGAEEVCDGRDQNCNQLVDEPDFLAAENSFCIDLYRDADGDGFGDQGATECLCVDLQGELAVEYDNELYVATFSDCDDLHADIRPHGCNDGSDNDADGFVDAVDPDCAPVEVDGVMRQPTSEDASDVAYVDEVFDGHDNDCDGFVPFVELDCDDDGSLAALPVGEVDRYTSAEDLGLARCDGPPIQKPCWDETLTLECDTLSGLWVTRWGASDDGFGGRFSRAYRNLESTACDRQGDCDDHCPARCPGEVETCDGLDNDCSGIETVADTDGIPNAMEDAPQLGTTSSTEVDFDGDGFAACIDAFSPNDEQTTPALATCTPTVVEGRDSDCDDGCYLANDQATEACNGFRDVCDPLAALEGSDSDRDGHRTCGQSGPVDSELNESFYAVVWAACDDTMDACADVTVPPPEGVPSWVPLLLPRPGAPNCDGPLEDALIPLLESVGSSLDGMSDETDLAVLCDPATGGVCTTVELAYHGTVDSVDYLDLADEEGVLTAACEAAPHEYHSRSVWPAERMVAARRLVVETECMRLYGVRCLQVDEDALTTGSPVPPNIDDRLADPDLWWQEIGRFLPDTTAGAMMTCWGDPTSGLEQIEDAVGGDCDDTRLGAHRDQPEGPDDLLGVFLDEAGDCDRCTDGIDNNCDGLTDCEDPSCALCFVGEARGCRGARNPCNLDEEGGGCQTSGAGGGSLIVVALLALLGRRRRPQLPFTFV